MQIQSRALSGVAALTVGLLVFGLAAPALAGGKTPSSSNLKSLTNSLNQAKHLTYLANYTSNSGGETTKVTIAQSPPKSAFTSGTSSVINTGSTTYICSGSSGSQSCLSAGGSNPLAGLEELFSPTAAVAALAEARQGLASKTLGIKTTSSTQTIGGQPSTCISVSAKGNVAKYCVTKQGLLSYAGTSSSNFQLTSLSTKPPASAFVLPAGATTITLPKGIKLPKGVNIP
jgi:hypothetical protein